MIAALRERNDIGGERCRDPAAHENRPENGDDLTNDREATIFSRAPSTPKAIAGQAAPEAGMAAAKRELAGAFPSTRMRSDHASLAGYRGR